MSDEVTPDVLKRVMESPAMSRDVMRAPDTTLATLMPFFAHLSIAALVACNNADHRGWAMGGDNDDDEGSRGEADDDRSGDGWGSGDEKRKGKGEGEAETRTTVKRNTSMAVASPYA